MTSWTLQKDKVFSYLEKTNRENLLEGTVRILSREESLRWQKIIKSVTELECIPYGLGWDGFIHSCTLDKSVAILPEYGLLIPGNKTYLEILKELFDAEEDLSKSDFLRGNYKNYQKWQRKNKGVELKRDQVAGLVLPLSLGGKDTADNRQVIDAEVYFTMTWQISQQVN